MLLQSNHGISEKILRELLDHSDNVCSVWRKKPFQFFRTYVPPSLLYHPRSELTSPTSQGFRKPRVWKHALYREIQEQYTQQKTFWKKAAPESHEKTEMQFVLLGATEKSDIQIGESKETTWCNSTAFLAPYVSFKTTHHKGLILRISKSWCSLACWVACPRLILELEKERFHESCHYA